jgi:hypothetical protein
MEHGLHCVSKYALGQSWILLHRSSTMNIEIYYSFVSLILPIRAKPTLPDRLFFNQFYKNKKLKNQTKSSF